MGRDDKVTGKPFRFILNHSKATVANVLRKSLWWELHKIEPKELGNSQIEFPLK